MSDMPGQQVELVSADGETTGTCPKLEAHLAPGLLHRAVSVVIFDGDNRTLLHGGRPARTTSPTAGPIPAAPIPAWARIR